jgi:hypothetical protein
MIVTYNSQGVNPPAADFTAVVQEQGDVLLVASRTSIG